MSYQELYVVCQIDDFSLKVMVNRYFNDKIQVLYKENITNQQFANEGTIINPEATGKKLREIINKIEQIFKIQVERISLSLPANNLKIYQSQANLDFKRLQHQINLNDVNKVIEMSKNIVIGPNEIICLTKPYNFKVDHNNYHDQFPLAVKGQFMTLDSLIYTVPKILYDSQMAALEHAQCQLLSFTLEQFALAFSFNEKANHNIVLIDWAVNHTKVSVFSNSALYAVNNIKLGYNQIVNALMEKMHCDATKAEKYLLKVINVNSNYLNDLIVAKYCDADTKKVTTFSKSQLQGTVRTVINEIAENIEYFLADIINENPEIEIICSGLTTNLPGFSTYLKNYVNLKNIKFMINTIPAVDSYEWLSLIGVTYYQHNLNLFNNSVLTSINNQEVKAANALYKDNKNQKVTSQLKWNY